MEPVDFNLKRKNKGGNLTDLAVGTHQPTSMRFQIYKYYD
jgi:hypothetical protein